MSNLGPKTGNPPPRRRYRVSYRARPFDDPEGSWSFGDMIVFARSEEDARAFASEIGGDGINEYQILECEEITKEGT
jgi:hypothetical protein